MSNFKKYVAEFLGTMVLVFMGCGSAVLSGNNLSIAFAFGLSVVAMAYAIGNISGCHLNPAVSLAALIDKRIGMADFYGYIVSQIIGGIVGAGLLKIVFHYAGMTGLGSNTVSGAGGIGGAFLIEVILTFIFVLTVLSVTADSSKSSVAGIVIGFTLTLIHIVGIPLTGTSVNPARSIGPALFTGGRVLNNLWVFIAAPLAGAAFAAIVYRKIKEKSRK